MQNGNSPFQNLNLYAPQQHGTPEQQAYFKLNNNNGQLANAGINNMPFVLDPAMLFNQSREQLQSRMYQPKPAEGGAEQPQQPTQPQDPAAQLLGLIEKHPELLPIIMQMQQGPANPNQTPNLNQGF
jgi:hypothetical protein